MVVKCVKRKPEPPDSGSRNCLYMEMTSPKSVGRMVGVLMLLHLAVALMVPFIMLERVRGSEGLLANAAASPLQVRVAVLLLFVGSALAIGIAITALRVFRQYSEPMAFWLVALATAAFTLQAVDNGAILSLLSLSQEYAQAGAAKSELFQSLGLVVNAARKWAHYTYLLIAVSWIFLLYCQFFRFRFIPRPLAALGLVGCLLQIYGVTLRGFFGYPLMTVLAMPLAPIQLAAALWLLVKGFAERQPPLSVTPKS